MSNIVWPEKALKRVAELKQSIHEYDQLKGETIAEMAKDLEGLIPKEKIASKIIYDIKKMFTEKIRDSEADLSFYEHERSRVKAVVNEVLSDEYKIQRSE